MAAAFVFMAGCQSEKIEQEKPDPVYSDLQYTEPLTHPAFSGVITWNESRETQLKGVNLITTEAPTGKTFHPSSGLWESWNFGYNNLTIVSTDQRQKKKVYSYDAPSPETSLTLSTIWENRFADGSQVNSGSGFHARMIPTYGSETVQYDSEGNPIYQKDTEENVTYRTFTVISYDVEGFPTITVNYEVVDPKNSPYTAGAIYKKEVTQYTNNPMEGKYSNTAEHSNIFWMVDQPYSDLYKSSRIQYKRQNGQFVKSHEQRWDLEADENGSRIVETYTRTHNATAVVTEEEKANCNSDSDTCSRRVTTYDFLYPANQYSIVDQIYRVDNSSDVIKTDSKKVQFHNHEVGLLAYMERKVTDKFGNGRQREDTYNESGQAILSKEYELVGDQKNLFMTTSYTYNPAGNQKTSGTKYVFMTNPLETSYTYDSQLRITAITTKELTDGSQPLDCDGMTNLTTIQYKDLPKGNLQITKESKMCLWPGPGPEMTTFNKIVSVYNTNGQMLSVQRHSRDFSTAKFNFTEQTSYDYAENGTLSKVQNYDINYDTSNDTYNVTAGNFALFEYDENLFLTAKKSFYATGEQCSDMSSEKKATCQADCSPGTACYSKSTYHYNEWYVDGSGDELPIPQDSKEFDEVRKITQVYSGLLFH